jgi:peptidoglycan LD-endopeptidase LytH
VPTLRCFPCLILLGLLFLAGCAAPALEATSTPRVELVETQAPTATRTPFHPSTPTAPRRSTPIVTLTPVVFPSLTHIPAKYVFPVQPVSKATYAEGVEGHGYPATDIFALEGTKFVAVIAGVVDFVSTTDQWNPEQPDSALRSGLAVAIIGSDGLRYYGSHLSRIEDGIAPGVQVKAGQLLGYVGSSGDARGKTPHLHFGISRPTYPGDWKTRRGELDPFPYLNAWKEGIDLEPVFP